MEIAEELRKWVQCLSTAEKRFVKLQGKSRAGSDSQLLGLFDWLNRAEDNEPVPADAAFVRNLPTLSIRLRTLILDSLRLLRKDDSVDSRLQTMMDEIALMQSKKLHHAAGRQVRKAKKIAYDHCRYTFLLLLIGKEQEFTRSLPVEQFADALPQLRAEELDVFAKQQRLCELQFRHDNLLLLARQFPFSLKTEVINRARELAEANVVLECLEEESHLENALAVNMLGIRDLFIRDPDTAVMRYQQLLRKWQERPEWQMDQLPLLLTICNYYQNACIFSPVDHEKARESLAFLKGFDRLPPQETILLQDLLYNNQFTFALNTGNFDVVRPLIGEIDQWLVKHAQQLGENKILPFLCNFAVAEFLTGNFSAAKRFITRILNRHNRKVRVDIFDFAIILRAVLGYQLEENNLDEYLIRSGKRHFSKNKIAVDFGLVVFRHVEELANAGSSGEKTGIFGRLLQSLDRFAEKFPGTIPLLGLNELHMWAEAGSTGVPIREIFDERVRKNLKFLEEQEKL